VYLDYTERKPMKPKQDSLWASRLSYTLSDEPPLSSHEVRVGSDGSRDGPSIRVITRLESPQRDMDRARHELYEAHFDRLVQVIVESIRGKVDLTWEVTENTQEGKGDEYVTDLWIYPKPPSSIKQTVVRAIHA